jgi:hypothetical protein
MLQHSLRHSRSGSQQLGRAFHRVLPSWCVAGNGLAAGCAANIAGAFMDTTMTTKRPARNLATRST